DVVQETWLAACRGLHAYRGDAKFSTWLTSIGVRASYTLLSRAAEGDAASIDEIAAPAPAPTDGPATTIDLERALASLPDVPRMVVVLHDIEGFTHDEIAEQLG